jgi:hypothetical protein
MLDNQQTAISISYDIDSPVLISLGQHLNVDTATGSCFA